MIVDLIFHPYFYLPYVFFNFLLSLYIYKVGKKYWEEKYISIEESMNILLNLKKYTGDEYLNDKYNIHSLFSEFKRYDRFSLPRIFFGLVFLFWIRIFLVVIVSICCYSVIKITFWNDTSKKVNPTQRKIVKMACKIFGSMGIFIGGFICKETRDTYPEIYKKYLGSNYESDFDSNYSTIISNHTGWIDILFYFQKYAPGFISKESVLNIPFFGVIASRIECLFLDRTKSENRQYIANEIKIRQDSFLSRGIETPLMIFPEGTLTSGHHILKFKRGAFQNLQSVKPIMIKLHDNDQISLSAGTLKFSIHLFYSLCHFYHYVSFHEIPIIKPTEFMFKNYSHLGKEKWEVYAEVVRQIYCEIGGFQKSNKTFDDMLSYISLINGKTVLNC